MGHQQFENSPQSAGSGASIAMVIVHAWAYSVEIFLHKANYGSRYVAWQGPAVLFLIPTYCLVCDGHSLRPMLLFLLAYLAMCLVVRVKGIANSFESQIKHSRYSGTPRLMAVIPLSEVTIKHYVEPALVLAVALLMFRISPPLGLYLLVAACCLFLMVSEARRHIEVRAAEMNDAVIEQELIAERFREMRGERWF